MSRAKSGPAYWCSIWRSRRTREAGALIERIGQGVDTARAEHLGKRLQQAESLWRWWEDGIKASVRSLVATARCAEQYAAEAEDRREEHEAQRAPF